MTAQWQGLLQSLGTWQGSFTQLSLEGVPLNDIPSEVTLALSEDEKTVHLTLKREGSRDIDLNFTYPGPGLQVPFFENGCFSQGSLQHARSTQFGAEFGFVAGDRRLRLVQMYQQGTDLTGLTLIRESRAGTGAVPSPPLQVSDLLGTWQGEALILYNDHRSDTIPTHLVVEQTGDRLTQTLQFGTQTLQTSAHINGTALHFNQGTQPMQLLCLPGGASALFPPQIQPHTPFVLEAGWLIHPTLRLRMIRSYNDRGEWVSLTLVTEAKEDCSLSKG